MKPYKDAGRWRVDVNIKGKRHRLSLGPEKYMSYADAKLEAERRVKTLWNDALEEQRNAPTLERFLTERFAPWAKNKFEIARPKNWTWYRTGVRSLLRYKPLAAARLSKIAEELVSGFKAFRIQKGVQVCTVNSELQVLRSALNRAVEWKVLGHAPRIKLLGGENHRERVLTTEEESRYLAATPEPLASIATLLVDSGIRPDECFRLRWEQITWEGNGSRGSLLIERGKTASARRVIWFTPRVRMILESQYNRIGRPQEGWVWPAETRSGHAEPSTVRKQHQKALRVCNVRPFVLYDLRHTFLTRLGTSGVDPWTFMRIAGHSNTDMGKRYVHPSGEDMLKALERARRNSSPGESSDASEMMTKPPLSDSIQ